jgi:hypothetical protein
MQPEGLLSLGPAGRQIRLRNRDAATARISCRRLQTLASAASRSSRLRSAFPRLEAAAARPELAAGIRQAACSQIEAIAKAVCLSPQSGFSSSRLFRSWRGRRALAAIGNGLFIRCPKPLRPRARPRERWQKAESRLSWLFLRESVWRKFTLGGTIGEIEIPDRFDRHSQSGDQK